jgi:hypothetical protein
MFVSMERLHIPYPRFRAALDAGDLGWIRRNAAALAPIRLQDALEICLLVRDRDPERYVRAAVRWLGRFALEAPAATLEDLRLAVAALEDLPDEPEEAMEQLAALCLRHGLASA